MTKNEKSVIEVLRNHICKCFANEMQHESYPEEIGSSTGVRLCDAIWKGSGIAYAVEHTTIDSFTDQRCDDERFRKLMGKLEKEWSYHPDDWIEIAIEVTAIPTGVNWDNLLSQIQAWLIQNVPSLPDNCQSNVRIPGVPFQLHIFRKKMPGQGKMVVARLKPRDLSEQRVAVIRRALDKKIGVLQQYKNKGYSSILLLESSDYALSSRDTIFKDLCEAYQPETDGSVFDHIYIATTGTNPWCIVPFKMGGEIMKEPNPSWPTAPYYPFEVPIAH